MCSDVLLQDSVLLRRKYPNHLLFKAPALADMWELDIYKTFEADVLAEVERSEAANESMDNSATVSRDQDLG